MKPWRHEPEFEEVAFRHFGEEWEHHPVINLLHEEFGHFVSRKSTKHLTVIHFESGLFEIHFHLSTACCRVELSVFFEETEHVNVMRNMVVFSISSLDAA